MKKAKADIEETVVFRPGGTDRAIRELAQATHRLTMRRIRDSLPGRVTTKRLVLRAPIRGDVPDLVKLADNKTIADRLLRLPHPYTRADASGKESSYDETVRVSVQVLCGEGSIPAPDSAQQPGDCKVVRYFSGSLEP